MQKSGVVSDRQGDRIVPLGYDISFHTFFLLLSDRVPMNHDRHLYQEIQVAKHGHLCDKS
jgi:hypothetical protein